MKVRLLIHPPNPPDPSPVINVVKNSEQTSFPAYLSLGHRHLEKGEISANGDKNRFTIPLDLLSLVIPQDVLEEVEEVQFIYEKKS